MFFRRYVIAALSAALVTSSGCGPSAVKRACMGGSGGGNALVDGAAMMRLDVYDPSVACVDGVLPDGSGSPVLSHSYVAGQAISLDVPPGAHTLVLTTFADQAGTVALGQACTTETVQAGAQICFDLTVLPAPIGADLSVISCTVTPNSCPAGYYCDGSSCQNGCASDTDCAGGGPDGGASDTPYCDVVTHHCVECTMTNQCPSGDVCMNGACALGCGGTQYCEEINGKCNPDCTLTCNNGFADCDGDPKNGCETNLGVAGKKLCNGMCIAATSCCSSSDCTTPPSPATCYNGTGTCSAPGGSCSYTEKSGAQICDSGTTCCDPVNGSCNATCMLTCSSGYLDCNMNVSDGCETACAPANGTGKCAPGGGCAVGTCNTGFHDCDGSASDGCECGTMCCTNPNTGMQDCQVNTHSDGEGHTFSACYPLGMPGTYDDTTSTGTPGAGYSAADAADAANADVAQSGTLLPGLVCSTSGGGSVTSTCKSTNQNNGTCTCWAYAASSGNCKDPTDNVMKPCVDFIGHVFASAKACLCVSVTDASWQ